MCPERPSPKFGLTQQQRKSRARRTDSIKTKFEWVRLRPDRGGKNRCRYGVAGGGTIDLLAARS
jgi:hypothetical protein